MLEVVDDVTRECAPAILDTSISGSSVARELTALIERRGRPGMIVSDYWTKLTSNTILNWCAENKVESHYFAPGQPIRNRFVENFNGRMRDEFLNETLFRNLAHARDLIADPGGQLQHRTSPLSPRLSESYGLRHSPITAIAHPAARDESSSRRAIAQPAPKGVHQLLAPLAVG